MCTCSSALHEAVGKTRDGPEWNMRNVTVKQSVICAVWKVASTQIAECSEPNTVLWAFHTIQPSSCNCASSCHALPSD